MDKIYICYTEEDGETIFLRINNKDIFFTEKEKAIDACKKKNMEILGYIKCGDPFKYAEDMDVMGCKTDEEFVDYVSRSENTDDGIFREYYTVKELHNDQYS